MDNSNLTLNNAASRIRAAFGRPSPEEQAKTELLGRLESTHKYLAEARRKAETEWWLTNQFINNNQVMYNVNTKRIQQVADRNGDRVIVNKMAQIDRGVVAYLNKEHPSSTVLPGINEDAAYDRAKKEKHFIDNIYADQQMNKKTKQVTQDGFRYKNGWFKIIWDAYAMSPTSPYTDPQTGRSGHKLPGKVIIDRVDPFDLYFDPTMTEMSNCKEIDHVMPKTIGEIKSNPMYKDTAGLQGDRQVASSILKSNQIRNQSGVTGQFHEDADNDRTTVLLHETCLQEWKDGRQVVRVVTWTTGRIHADRYWPIDEMPYEFYQADISGSLLDGGGPCRNLRDINRSINQLNTQVQENARIMGKINWRVPRGSNVNVITDETGQFIEHDASPGGHPEQLTPSSLPNYIPEQIARLERYMEDLGGSHDASYGRSPGSRASGSLVNQLQEGDNNNLSMMRDNLDDCLARVYRKALLTFKACAKGDLAVRGEVNPLGMHTWLALKPEEVSTEDTVVIRTGTNMPYSLEQKQALIIDLKKEGILEDNQQILKLLEFPDVEAVTGTDQLDIERATAENKAMFQGTPIHEPLRVEDHNTHIRVHGQLMKSPLFYTLAQDVQDVITQHYMQHVQVSVELKKIAASMDYEPIKRNLTLQFRPNNFNEVTPQERTEFMGDFGVASDANAIAQRGGLFVQDPAEAEKQAQLEDNEMMDAKPVQISIGDNHQVHIQTHTQIMDTAAFEQLPAIVQKMFTDHVTQHEIALQATAQMPGLVSTPAATNPVKVTLPKPLAKPGPVNQAAMNPTQAAPRPLAPNELLQHKGAVKNRLASEKMMAMTAAKAKAQKATTSSKKAK